MRDGSQTKCVKTKKGLNMDENTFQYIYDAMCWVLDLLDDLSNPDYDQQYRKLDKAIDLFYRWHEKEIMEQNNECKTI